MGLLLCAIQPTVSTCIAMTKSDVKVAILDLITLSYCCHCGSDEETSLRSAESATAAAAAAAMPAMFDDEVAETVTPRVDELNTATTKEKEIDEDTTPMRTGTSASTVAVMPTMMDEEEAGRKQ